MVMAEFGGSLVDESVDAEAVGCMIVSRDPDMSSRMTGDEIELAEVQPRRQSSGIAEV